MKMNGARAVLESLRQEGVNIVFGYPGGAVLDLYDEIYKEKFPHLLVRHEQGAAHAADGFARATGKVGVALATSGPGGTNLVTGIATANMDSIPMVCITGQVGNPFIGKDSFQEADICGITTPITKHNYLVKDVHDLPHVLREAFFIARTGRPGPVVVDIAKDVFTQEFDFHYPENVHLKGYRGAPLANQGDVIRAAEVFSKARRPLFLIGGGVTLSDTTPILREILDWTSAPSASTLLGIGCVPSDRPDFLGMVGMHGTYTANEAIQNADLLIACGMRFDDRVTSNIASFAPHAKVIHFEADAAEIGKNREADVAVLGDLRETLPLFLDELKPWGKGSERIKGWRDKLVAMKDAHPLTYHPILHCVMPQAVVQAVGDILPEAVIVTDVGQHQMWAAQYFPAIEPRRFLSSGGLGTMGYGLPAAIGAKVGEPNRDVVLFTGDGSIMMNCQELATAADNNIDIKIIVIHNRVLGMVTQWQRMFYKKHYSQTLLTGKTDLVKLAEAMGVKGARIKDPQTYREELEGLLKEKGPMLIDVMTPSQLDVLPMVPGGKGLDEMVIEKTSEAPEDVEASEGGEA